MAGEEDFLGAGVDDTRFLDSQPMAGAPRRVSIRGLTIVAVVAAAVAALIGYSIGHASASSAPPPNDTSQQVAGAEGHITDVDPEPVAQTLACQDALELLMDQQASGAATDDESIGAFSERCSTEFPIWTNVQSLMGFYEASGAVPCADYGQYSIPEEALIYARDLGYCTGEPTAEPAAEWSCYYDPSYDDDWHNDVVCSNGSDSERPYLRPNDNFVTEDEIMESARAYERQLNGS